MAELSIIIPAYNEASDLPNLVESIRREVSLEVDIVVVDNGSSDGTGELAQQLGCRLIKAPGRMFPSAARNFGAQHCDSPVLVFLDADVIVTATWAREVERLAGDRDFLEGWSVTGESCHISKSPAWIERFWFEPLRRNGRTFVNGANMIISRKAFETSSGFNSKLETGEDVEFSERAMQCGITVKLNPKLIVHHEGFPKDLKSFFEREKWHGVGDFSSFSFFMRSKVAQIVAVIGLCYLVMLLLLPFAFYGVWDNTALVMVACLSLIFSACAASSLAKFWKVGPVYCTAGVFIYFIYFNARLMSLLSTLRNSRWTKDGGLPEVEHN